MSKTVYWADPADPSSVAPILTVIGAKDSPFEGQLLKVLSLHSRPFAVTIDYVTQAPREAGPVQDPFTFDMETDELVVFTEDPAAMVDAFIEMAMYMRGFSTLIGLEEDWKVAIAIGGWKHLRQGIRLTLGLPSMTEKTWVFMMAPEAAREFNANSFSQLAMLAGCPNVEVLFPPGSDARLVEVYPQLARVIEVVAEGLGIQDYAEFNARLRRAVMLIEERLAPTTGESIE